MRKLKKEKKEGKKRNRLSKKNIYFIISILIFIFSLTYIFKSFSLFETNSKGVLDVDVALYVVEEDYQTMNLNLGKIYPNNSKHEYTFGILNTKDGKRAEVDLEYETIIRRTTNIPVDIKIFEILGTRENEITNESIYKDEDGTYFKRIRLPKKELKHTKDEYHKYKIVMNLPEEYNNFSFSDLMEVLEISVNAKQIINE